MAVRRGPSCRRLATVRTGVEHSHLTGAAVSFDVEYDRWISTPRRRLLAVAGALGTTALAGCQSVTAQEQTPPTETPSGTKTPSPLAAHGIVTVERDASVETVVDELRSAIETNENLTLVTVVDHAANAESVGQELRPTTLLVFGNPALGSVLMQANQTAGLDLPQKFLVFEDETGQTTVAYNDPAFVAQRHGITGQEETLSTIRGALQSLASGA
ncbi:DUF302 domain-containing protein [Haloarculaceae archaeon H-GB11]|nr:DUF302 domain-containing protein [Haloarculaceae archaeon H-GB11]